jgi:hypothetical protein
MREVARAERVAAKPIKGKGRRARMKAALAAKAAGDGFRVDTQDTRFAAMFTSPLFAVDPSHPRYRTKAPAHA